MIPNHLKKLSNCGDYYVGVFYTNPPEEDEFVCVLTSIWATWNPSFISNYVDDELVSSLTVALFLRSQSKFSHDPRDSGWNRIKSMFVFTNASAPTMSVVTSSDLNLLWESFHTKQTQLEALSDPITETGFCWLTALDRVMTTFSPYRGHL